MGDEKDLVSMKAMIEAMSEAVGEAFQGRKFMLAIYDDRGEEGQVMFSCSAYDSKMIHTLEAIISELKEAEDKARKRKAKEETQDEQKQEKQNPVTNNVMRYMGNA